MWKLLKSLSVWGLKCIYWKQRKKNEEDKESQEERSQKKTLAIRQRRLFIWIKNIYAYHVDCMII